MFELPISILISVMILVVLALFVPCMESFARLIRSGEPQRKAISKKQEERAYKRDVA